ncbi:MAG: hypothetical protein IPP33_11925 [Flavobacteriales bacterium]|nr:hypothetical protein [Flavobacteriales bacterium]
MNGLVRALSKLVQHDRPWSCLLVALLFKSALFVVLIMRFRYSAFPGYWGGISHDSYSYIEPIEHLLASGSYFPDLRMPGYGLPYGLLRLLLPQAHALNALLVLQLIMDAIAVVLLARIAWMITRNRTVFASVFWIYAISSFVSLYDVLPLTESLTTSTLVIGTYAAFRSLERSRLSLALCAGFCFTWAAFMRPVMFPLLMLPPLIYLMHRTTSMRVRSMLAVFSLLPFIAVESAWIGRNYMVHGTFVPITTSLLMPDYLETPNYHVGLVVRSFGGSLTWWDPDASDAYVRSFKHEHPWHYHVVAPLRLLGIFTLHSGTYLDLPRPRNVAERSVKWFYSALYLGTMLLGSAGAIVALFHRRWPRWALMVPLMFGYGLLVHPFVLRFCEYRYLVPFYPWALVMAVWFVHTLFTRQHADQST